MSQEILSTEAAKAASVPAGGTTAPVPSPGQQTADGTATTRRGTETDDELEFEEAPPPSGPQRIVKVNAPYAGNCRHISEYDLIQKIGEGTYGVVHKARDRKNNTIVALKQVRMEREKDGFPLTCLREVKLLSSVHHPNVVNMIEVVAGKELNSMYLSLEYCEHDLACLLDCLPTSFNAGEIKCLMIQLLEAVAHLHEAWIMHRDLKMSNLLMNNKGQLKLADFGLARAYGRPARSYTSRVVTLWYRAPELLLGQEHYTPAVDTWAIGCIFGELLKRAPIMPARTEMQQVELIFKLLGTPHDSIWPGYSKLSLVSKIKLPKQPYNRLKAEFPTLSENGIDLLNKLLTYDPNKRISARQALRHPYFTEDPLPKTPADMPSFPPSNENRFKGRRRRRSGDGRGFGFAAKRAR